MTDESSLTNQRVLQINPIFSDDYFCAVGDDLVTRTYNLPALDDFIDQLNIELDLVEISRIQSVYDIPKVGTPTSAPVSWPQTGKGVRTFRFRPRGKGNSTMKKMKNGSSVRSNAKSRYGTYRRWYRTKGVHQIRGRQRPTKGNNKKNAVKTMIPVKKVTRPMQNLRNAPKKNIFMRPNAVVRKRYAPGAKKVMMKSKN